MLFKSKQIDKILETVDFYHNLYIAENIGISVLSKTDKLILQRGGIDLSQYKGKIGYVEYAYNFGKLESSVRDVSMLKKLNLKDYKKFVDLNQDKFKLSKEDKFNIRTAKQQAYNDIKRLAGDVKADLHANLIEVSKTHYEKLNQKTLPQQVARAVTKKLKENTVKYSSRFELISSYNMHSTYQTGLAAEILERLGPMAKVYFKVQKSACPVCVKTYLKNGPGSQPRIFLLKTVINNGSNIGRKGKDIKSSLQPLHPRCRCKLTMVPKGKIKYSVNQNAYIRVFK